MTLVIMAAGMGSRYGGIKQIDPMGPNGEIILDYSVYDAIRAGFDRVVFIIRQDINDAFKESISGKFKGKIAVDYAFQELNSHLDGFKVPEDRVKPWGTGHAILTCRNLVQEPFIVINADDFYGAEAFEESIKGLRQLDSASLEGFIVGYRLKNTLSPHGSVTRGVCESDGTYLTKVTERLKIGLNSSGLVEYQEGDKTFPLTGGELVSMNFWGFTPKIFEVLEMGFSDFLAESGSKLTSEYLIPETVGESIESGKLKVRVLQSSATWFGVTYPEDKPAVKTCLSGLVQEGAYPSPLWD